MKNQKWKLMGMGSAALLATALTISPALSDDHDGDWPSYAGDKKSSRYMAGGVATPESVKKMKIAWRFSMPGVSACLATKLLLTTLICGHG